MALDCLSPVFSGNNDLFSHMLLLPGLLLLQWPVKEIILFRCFSHRQCSVRFKTVKRLAILVEASGQLWSLMGGVVKLQTWLHQVNRVEITVWYTELYLFKMWCIIRPKGGLEWREKTESNPENNSRSDGYFAGTWLSQACFSNSEC